MNRPPPIRSAPFWLRFVSALSGGSLVFFGVGSLLLTLAYWSLAGFLVGSAMAIHGGLELWQRRRLLVLGRSRSARILAINQIALGVTISIYLGAQLADINAEAVNAALQEVFQALGGALPEETLDQLKAELVPAMRIVVFGLIGSVWLGCVGMALYYFNYGRGLEEERLLDGSGGR